MTFLKVKSPGGLGVRVKGDGGLGSAGTGDPETGLRVVVELVE
jgi:hypothetical protein